MGGGNVYNYARPYKYRYIISKITEKSKRLGGNISTKRPIFLGI